MSIPSSEINIPRIEITAMTVGSLPRTATRDASFATFANPSFGGESPTKYSRGFVDSVDVPEDACEWLQQGFGLLREETQPFNFMPRNSSVLDRFPLPLKCTELSKGGASVAVDNDTGDHTSILLMLQVSNNNLSFHQQMQAYNAPLSVGLVALGIAAAVAFFPSSEKWAIASEWSQFWDRQTGPNREQRLVDFKRVIEDALEQEPNRMSLTSLKDAVGRMRLYGMVR
ncbi:hypothetical protein NliqN6_5992 [Naganishia liquefaciens]|uniref:Uncharacterized protein n=1 Tax=Naganishia liquefaciens TaxID=104408 RepID=A0A8H3YH52_9TREE|nr:hypothetical protein NliqN6_5992 [Naganishia liquefaciens]